ncbi:MAG TPA: CAP domain-containing protein [Agriterribacter sp.]|nr:CAP domain-containing protein [Agriterribacter sp.]
MRLNFWGCILLVLFTFSCNKEDLHSGVSGSKPTDGQKPDIAYNLNAGVMLDMINEVRTSGCTCGSTVMPSVAALAWNDQLAKAAYDHSKDMEVNNYFSHVSGNNETTGDRITAAGYNWRAYGENIALGQTTEQIVMNSWLNSEGHCKNIMNKSFKDIGAGRSGNYWTQVFGAK